MKSIIIMAIALSSVCSFAESSCKVFIQDHNSSREKLSNDQDSLLRTQLRKNNFQIVDSRSVANYVLDISQRRRTYNLLSTLTGNLYEGDNSVSSMYANDAAFGIPAYLLTYGLADLIPSKGRIVMKKFAKRLPKCEDLQNDKDLAQINNDERNSSPEVNNTNETGFKSPVASEA